MSPPAANLEAALVAAWPEAEWRDVHVLLAVSGGADSVALLRAAIAVKERSGGQGKLYVAHLNHGLRPVEAAADEEWLAELCRRLNVPLETGRCDVRAIAADRGDGLEEAARTARHEFLRATAERLGARFVAFAHTADDQVETVLHRLIRGTGIAGLAGMPCTRPLSPTVALVRPLLDVGRSDVLGYLQKIGQDFRVDSTNADVEFTRNRLRNELLPRLRADFNVEVDAALLRLARQAEEAQQLIAARAAELFSSAVRVSPSGVQIDGSSLAGESPLVVRETCKLAWTAAGWPLQNMGFDEWQLLQELVVADSGSGNLNLPGRMRVERKGGRVNIAQAT